MPDGSSLRRKVTGHLTDAMFDRYDILDDEDLKRAIIDDGEGWLLLI
jgi:hypothetical protein